MNLLLPILLATTLVGAPPSGNASKRPTEGALFEGALSAYVNGRPYEAIATAEQALERRGPLRESWLYLLGRSFGSIHLEEKSASYLRQLVRDFLQGPYTGAALVEMATLYFDLGEYEASASIVDRQDEKVPDAAVTPELRYLIGQSHYLAGRAKEAARWLRVVGSNDPSSPYARYTLAQSEFALGRPELALEAISALGPAPGRLESRASLTKGRILYHLGRPADAIDAYARIAPTSALYGQSRIDLALAAEAARDDARLELALRQAAEWPEGTLRLRAEAEVALGQLRARRGAGAEARSAFESAIQRAKSYRATLELQLQDDSLFRRCFDELVLFWESGKQRERSDRLRRDVALFHQAVRSATARSVRVSVAEAGYGTRPQSPLFPVLHERFHRSLRVKPFIELATRIDALTRETRAVADVWRGETESAPNSQLTQSSAPEALVRSRKEMEWLALAYFDLASRVADSLAVTELITTEEATERKTAALVRALDAVRTVALGDRALIDRETVERVLEQGRERIEKGRVPGLADPARRQRYIDQWKMDGQSLRYALDGIERKEAQMKAALKGVPLRSRNLNVPVLASVTEWYEAVQRVAWKYRYLDRNPAQHPWVLAGRGNSVRALLRAQLGDLAALREGLLEPIRAEARIAIAEESQRLALIEAQSQEGIADALTR